jgi:hypothetical protein
MRAQRFLVFGVERYYPGGGMGDFLGSFATYEGAEQAVREWFSTVCAKADCGEGRCDIFDIETSEGTQFTANGYGLPIEGPLSVAFGK